MVKIEHPDANGISLSAGGSGACYAEYDMTGSNDDNTAYESCLFSLNEETEVIISYEYAQMNGHCLESTSYARYCDPH